jgi:hypothetical protein
MTRIGLAVASVGLAAAILTSCGGDSFTDQSGDKIAEDSKDAMGDLSAVKVAGTVTTAGQEITIDMQTNSDRDCTGSIKVGDGTAEIVGTGGTAWFRPDEAFWRASAADTADQIMSIVGDKWVVVPPGNDLAQFCDLDGLVDQMLESSEEDKKATYETGDTSEIDGDEVVAVNRKDEEGESTGYVLTDDPHYLVKIEKTDGGDTGTVTFSEFNEDFDAEAPSDDEIIDLNISG